MTKYGFRGNDSTIRNLTVKEDFTFGDASTDNLTVNGPAEFNGTVQIDGACSVVATSAKNHFRVGNQSDPVVVSSTYLKGAEIHAKCYNNLAGSSVIRGVQSRLELGTAGIDGASAYGVQAQLRVKPRAGVSQSLNGSVQGAWLYYEQSGTTAVASGGHHGGAEAKVETSATFTLDSGADLSALRAQSGINSSATLTGDCAAIIIDKDSGCKNWPSGIHFNSAIDSLFTIDAALTVCTTGYGVAGSSSGKSNGVLLFKKGATSYYIPFFTATTAKF